MLNTEKKNAFVSVHRSKDSFPQARKRTTSRTPHLVSLASLPFL